MIRLLTLSALFFAATPAAAWQPIDTCGASYARWSGTSTWRMTRSGTSPYYSQLSDGAVVDAVHDGFQVWSDASCCSSFAHSQGSDTTAGYSSSDNINAIEFYENSWPSSWGSVNSTIAITLPQYDWSTCIYYNADQAYNAVGFNFTTTSNPGSYDTDLQSITAHENGHWLGLDHSTSNGATMEAFYPGGTSARSLAVDDENGVCAIYPGSCGPAPATCPATLAIACDDTLVGSTVGGVNSVSSWACANWDSSGPEAVVEFTSAITGPVVIDLTGLSDDVDLFVTDDSGGSCDPNSCDVSGNTNTQPEQVTLNAVSGRTYQIVVDGYAGASSGFTLTTDCGGVGGTTGTGTGTATGTATGTGTGGPAGACAATQVLPCGVSVGGSNAGGVNEVESYDCSQWPLSGPEAVFELTPAATGQIVIDLTGLSDDLDLLVTADAGGACDPAGCLGVSANYDATSEQVSFQGVAGRTYMVVVDGWEGAVSGFDLFASCPSAGGTTGGTGSGTGSTGTGTGSATGGTGTGSATGGGTGTGTGGSATGGSATGGSGTGGTNPDLGGTGETLPVLTKGGGCGCDGGSGEAPLAAVLPLLLLALRRRGGSGPLDGRR